MLDGYIEKLNAVGVLPRSIALPLRTIQGYGNFAVHESAEHPTFTPEYIQPCLQSLSVVVDWYFSGHRGKVDVPEVSKPIGKKELSVGDFAETMGLTSAAVIRIAREALRAEFRTPSALLSQDQVAALETCLKNMRKGSSAIGSGTLKQFDLGGGVELEFTLIEGGIFRMGSPVTEEGHNDDEIEHVVTISRAFFLSRSLITQAQYKAVVGTEPSYFPAPTNPVEMVSWFDAVSFCELMAERFGKGFRLPTEAEWEYSCRAGTKTAFAVGGALSTEHANFDGRLGPGSAQVGLSRRTTTPVDSFPPNEWGLYDMHGNVWEWCADWYGAYPTERVIDPKGPDKGDIRILRGGSWFHGAADARSAQRDALDPGRRHSIYGFRVAFNEAGS
jgi:formylglycine-generating enzyme required for sulfatase activity